jgi:hypothetical protein
MNGNQQETIEKFAAHIKETNPKAIGVAFLMLGCGCLQGGPFDENGDQVGQVEHFLMQNNGGSIRLCPECMKDNGPPERVVKSAMVFFEPDKFTDDQKTSICDKIFCEAPATT